MEWIALSWLTWSGLACKTDVSVRENDIEGDVAGECSDGADNDRDGDYDCDDSDCESSPDCSGGEDSAPADPQDSAGEPADSEAGGDSDPGGGDPNNSPPSAPEVSTDLSCAEPDEDVRCVIVGESSDPDGDAVSYDFEWTADSGASSSGEVLDSSTTSSGELWTCTVTPYDGVAFGDSGSASISINGPCDTHISTSFSSGIGDWTVLGGDVSTADGKVSLVRTSDSWAAATWSSGRSDTGRITLQATLSTPADQGVVGVCVTDGSSDGMEVPGLGLFGKGYCMLLSTETDNGSSRGAFLMSNDVTGNATILASSLFSPTHGQAYDLAMTRTCAGEFTFSVEGSVVGTATNTYATEFSTVMLIGGQDDLSSDFPGGKVHDLVYQGCY